MLTQLSPPGTIERLWFQVSVSMRMGNRENREKKNLSRSLTKTQALQKHCLCSAVRLECNFTSFILKNILSIPSFVDSSDLGGKEAHLDSSFPEESQSFLINGVLVTASFLMLELNSDRCSFRKNRLVWLTVLGNMAYHGMETWQQGYEVGPWGGLPFPL